MLFFSNPICAGCCVCLISCLGRRDPRRLRLKIDQTQSGVDAPASHYGRAVEERLTRMAAICSAVCVAAVLRHKWNMWKLGVSFADLVPVILPVYCS